MSTTLTPSTRYLSANLGAAFLPAVGTVVDTEHTAPWSAAGTAAGIVPGRYAVEPHAVKATNAPTVKLTAADALTVARCALHTAERKLANWSNPTWIATETVKAQTAVNDARRAVMAAAPAPAPAVVAAAVTPAVATAPDLSAMLAGMDAGTLAALLAGLTPAAS